MKNNEEFLGRLRRFDFDYDFKLISFDVKTLFTNVPVDDLLEFLEQEIDKHTFSVDTACMMKLIKLCVKECRFIFNNEYYEQKFGMAMGNPLSPLLSNIYMEFFKAKYLPGILPRGILWVRYVDDIFCAWPIDKDENSFLTGLNTLVPSIKFSLEVEIENKLPFLDVLVLRQERHFKFNVYRKPTNVNSYIHYYSNHHSSTKLMVFSSMFLRALRVCCPEFLEAELKNIRNISSVLKYPSHFIDKALDKAKKSFYGVVSNRDFK